MHPTTRGMLSRPRDGGGHVDRGAWLVRFDLLLAIPYWHRRPAVPGGGRDPLRRGPPLAPPRGGEMAPRLARHGAGDSLRRHGAIRRRPEVGAEALRIPVGPEGDERRAAAAGPA